MIEPAMYFAIGFLFASLIGIIFIPLVHNRAVRLTMPIEELLRVRLAETLALPTRIFPLRPDGTFDPAGQKLN